MTADEWRQWTLFRSHTVGDEGRVSATLMTLRTGQTPWGIVLVNESRLYAVTRWQEPGQAYPGLVRAHQPFPWWLKGSPYRGFNARMHLGVDTNRSFERPRTGVTMAIQARCSGNAPLSFMRIARNDDQVIDYFTAPVWSQNTDTYFPS